MTHLNISNEQKHLSFKGKKIEDDNLSCLNDMIYLEEFDFSTNMFSTEQVAWIVSNFPNVREFALKPAIEFMVYNDRTGKSNVPTLIIVGKRKPCLVIAKNKKIIKRYMDNFERLVENIKGNHTTIFYERRNNMLLETLKARFEKNMNRHAAIKWASVQAKLEANNDKLWSLSEMERTGGKPDVVDYDNNTNEYIFFDCSVETPEGRKSLCYDKKALESRKKLRPEGSAVEMASSMGIMILNEEQYRYLQSLGNFDTKTSSWIETPDSIRRLGGALFCDFRYNTIFVYHNGADSYYGVRGFRGLLRV